MSSISPVPKDRDMADNQDYGVMVLRVLNVKLVENVL